MGGAAAIAAGAWAVRHETSPAVRRWRPGAGTYHRLGDLTARVNGRGGSAVVLLHGLVACGDAFGGAYDHLAVGRRLVAPDLLGFGRSMDVTRVHFSRSEHLAALDQLADELDLFNGDLIVAGHSMGGLLALYWSARHPGAVRRVVTWGAPLQPTRERALAAVGELGLVERLFALDTGASRAVCEWMCRHREAAAVLAVVGNPSLPVPIARRSVMHTWPAYREALDEIVLAPYWQEAVEQLDDSGVEVVLARGAGDPVADPAVYGPLADRFENVRTEINRHADHRLPLTDPAWCADLIDSLAREHLVTGRA